MTSPLRVRPAVRGFVLAVLMCAPGCTKRTAPPLPPNPQPPAPVEEPSDKARKENYKHNKSYSGPDADFTQPGWIGDWDDFPGMDDPDYGGGVWTQGVYKKGDLNSAPATPKCDRRYVIPLSDSTDVLKLFDNVPSRTR